MCQYLNDCRHFDFLKRFEDEKARVYLCSRAGSSDGYRAAYIPLLTKQIEGL
jgi:hypothetical protein